MLSNIKCLVTGASSGIGKATCITLTRHGATVIGTGRNVTSLQSLKASGDIADYIVADLTSPGSCKDVISRTIEILNNKSNNNDGENNGNGLTTIVNAAGILRGGAMDAVDMSNYDENMSVNCRSAFELMVHAIPHLKTCGKTHPGLPSILNVSSVNGKQSFASCVAYCMSKAAVDQMTRCAAVDLAGSGIRVNAVNPGVIKTNLHNTAGLSEEAYSAFLQRSIEITHPLSRSLGRVGTPKEVGELIAFLISDRATFITGECVAIDGGRQNLGAR